MKLFAASILTLASSALALAQLPTSNYKTADFQISFAPTAPGLVSASDLIDKPAGKSGSIISKEGHFYSGDKRIRFWGVNFCFGANFPTHDQADALATRLSNFGINAVRFHHMDNSPYPGGIFADATLSKLSDEALDRLDYFIAALKKQGVYANLNLHVSRNYARPHKWENAEKLENYDKIVDIFHPELIEANKAYARDLLTHVNKYTNLRYADEPAIAMIEINNEDTIFFWGGVQKLAALPDPYAKILQNQWNPWLRREYPSREKLLDKWGEKSLADDEDPTQSTVARGLLKGQTASHPRSADWYRFLQSTDDKYFTSMRDFLKKDLGVKCPITGTIALGPLGALSQSQMDFVDAHAYWDHPRFPRRQWDMKDWEIKNTPMSDTPATSALWGLAASRVAGKPFTVTEYNHAAPNEYQAECIPMIASFAALQDWDAVFLFSYSHNPKYEKPKTESFFDIEGNALKMPLMPLGSRIFVGQMMRPLTLCTFAHAAPDEMFKSGARFHSDTWNFVRQTQNITWQKMLESRFALAFGQNAHGDAADSQYASKATWTTDGNPATGRYAVQDERAVVFAGFPKDKSLDFPLIRLRNIENPFISLILISADGNPIVTSNRILLAIVGRGGNKDMPWNDKRKSTGDKWGSAPAQIEVVKAQLSLGTGSTMRVFPLDPTGQRTAAIPVRLENDYATFDLGSSPALWYEINRPEKLEPAR